MQIAVSVVNDGSPVEIYKQLLDDSTTMNAAVSTMMQQPIGDRFITNISNNGHTLTFNSSLLDLGKLVRVANGIIVREARAKKETT